MDQSDSSNSNQDNNDNSQDNKQNKKSIGSTTSLGKRRSLNKKLKSKGRQSVGSGRRSPQQPATGVHHQQQRGTKTPGSNDTAPTSPTVSTMSNPKTSEYGSQASPMRLPLANSGELNKVTILGAGGGIGQPLALLLMLHSEYIQHLALYDLVHVRGVAADLGHVDRQCKITSHLGPDELADAVRGAKVIVIPAGLAQKPGMSRDDLFGSNAKIMFNLARVCAQVAPEAMLAIISNPVNSLVPLTCEVYNWVMQEQKQQQQQQQQQQPSMADAANKQDKPKSDGKHTVFHDCFRRIFGVTTLDVVRASTLTAKSAFSKADSSGLFRDPAKIQVPVVGGHAGRTIIPLLSQASPKIDKKRLVEEKSTTATLIESIQQAGIEVLNAKKGSGSATLAMAYAACRFTISLLRALQGEQNIIECAYVRQQQAVVHDLDYFSTPLLLGKNGYIKSLGIGKVMPFEQQMIDEGAKELRMSVAKGEDFAKEQLSS